MKQTCVLACRTLERELLRAMRESRVDYPVVWVESGLHNSPEKLRARIQEELDAIAQNGVLDASGSTVYPARVLMAFGTCGNAIAGCAARDFELIVPRIDDCVSLMLGSMEKRQDAAVQHKAYYLTRGWMDGETNVVRDFARTCEKYGEEQGVEIYRSVLGGYRNLALIDTGTYDVDQLKEETRDFCRVFEWGQVVLPGDMERFAELLGGPWDEVRYIVKQPGEVITEADVRL